MIKVSVIIPMYNEEKYISRCLSSLAEQTRKDFEVILIDDGSTDKSIEIAEGFHDTLQLTILRQSHGGPGRARNLGAKSAEGDILVFLDADMMFHENMLEELVKPIDLGDEVGTVPGWEYVANKQHPIARAYSNIRLSYNPLHPRSGVFRAIKKDIFLTSGGYDDAHYAFEDNMAEKIGYALYIPTSICYHNNPESFGEIYKHEMRIGESLIAKGMLREYLHKYKLYLLVGVALVIVMIVLLAGKGMLRFIDLVLIVIAAIALCIIAITIRRTIKEKYLSHLIYIPLVLVTRGAGYIAGIIKHYTHKIAH